MEHSGEDWPAFHPGGDGKVRKFKNKLGVWCDSTSW